MVTPLLSVIMSIYKEPLDWLRQSIDSVLNQTFGDFEFIIICDNPYYEDGIRLLRDYEERDYRIKLLFNNENIGLTKSLNKGLSEANGKYIVRMDADDVSLPTRFEKQYSYLEKHPQVIVLGTAIKYMGKGSLFKPADGVRFGNKAIRAHMLVDNCIAHPTVFIRKSILDEHGITYDETYRQSQDCRLWEQLSPFGDFDNLREKLLKYRLSEQQITKSRSSSQMSLSNGVKLRWQKAWLDSIGFNYSLDDIEKNPFKIIDEISHNKTVIQSLQFHSFVQNAYLNADYRHKLKRLLINKEYHYVGLMNFLRIVSKSI